MKWSLLVSSILCFAGLFFLGDGLLSWENFANEIKHDADSVIWKKTDGKIVSSEVVSSKNNEGKETFSPAINYKYSLNGKEFTSNKVAFHSDFSAAYTELKTPKDIVAAFSPEKPVIVYVSSASPPESVLVPGVAEQTIAWNAPFKFFAGFVLFGLGLAYFVLYRDGQYTPKKKLMFGIFLLVFTLSSFISLIKGSELVTKSIAADSAILRHSENGWYRGSEKLGF